jgi:hypothetical protein
METGYGNWIIHDAIKKNIQNCCKIFNHSFILYIKFLLKLLIHFYFKQIIYNQVIIITRKKNLLKKKKDNDRNNISNNNGI